MTSFSEYLVDIRFSENIPDLMKVFAEAWTNHKDESSRVLLKATYDIRTESLNGVGLRDNVLSGEAPSIALGSPGSSHEKNTSPDIEHQKPFKLNELL